MSGDDESATSGVGLNGVTFFWGNPHNSTSITSHGVSLWSPFCFNIFYVSGFLSTKMFRLPHLSPLHHHLRLSIPGKLASTVCGVPHLTRRPDPGAHDGVRLNTSRHARVLEGGLTSASGCFSGGSWKALSPEPLTRCSIQFGFLFIVNHNPLCLSSISDNHPRSAMPRFEGTKVDELSISKVWTWSIKGPSSSKAITMKIKNLPVDSSGSVLSPSSSSLEEKTSLPSPLPMERDVSSVLLPSVCFRFLIGLSSCVAVSTEPEDAIEITLRFLVDEVWISTSHYVTILQLPDFVVNASPTHSSIVLNSMSSSVEELSCLSYLCIVFYVYGQRGWIIPSFSCMEED